METRSRTKFFWFRKDAAVIAVLPSSAKHTLALQPPAACRRVRSEVMDVEESRVFVDGREIENAGRRSDKVTRG